MALTEAQKTEIVERFVTGESQSALAREFGVSQPAIAKLIKTWKPPAATAVAPPHEAAAARRLHAAMHDPSKPFREALSVLDVQQVLLGYMRLTGVSAHGADD